MFKTNISSIFIYVIIGIISLIVIPILIIKNKKSAKNTNVKNSSSKKLFQMVYSQSKVLDFPFFYNILIKEVFNGKKFVHIPAGIINKENIYIFSDIIDKKKNCEIKYKENKIFLIKNKKEELVKNIDLKELKFIKKWLSNNLNINRENIKIVIPYNGLKTKEIDGASLVSIASLYDYIKNENENLVNVEAAISFIQKHNVIKTNIKNKNLERMMS